MSLARSNRSTDWEQGDESRNLHNCTPTLQQINIKLVRRYKKCCWQWQVMFWGSEMSEETTTTKPPLVSLVLTWVECVFSHSLMVCETSASQQRIKLDKTANKHSVMFAITVLFIVTAIFFNLIKLIKRHKPHSTSQQLVFGPVVFHEDTAWCGVPSAGSAVYKYTSREKRCLCLKVSFTNFIHECSFTGESHSARLSSPISYVALCYKLGLWRALQKCNTK